MGPRASTSSDSASQIQFTQNNDARPSKGSSATFSFSNIDTAGFAPTRHPASDAGQCVCQLHARRGQFGNHHGQQRGLGRTPLTATILSLCRTIGRSRRNSP